MGTSEGSNATARTPTEGNFGVHLTVFERSICIEHLPVLRNKWRSWRSGIQEELAHAPSDALVFSADHPLRLLLALEPTAINSAAKNRHKPDADVHR